MHPLIDIMLGAIVMGDLIVALFFLKFWKVTGDRFFVFFAASFATGAVSRVIIDPSLPPFGMELFGYFVRLLSYLIIVVAIVDKNRVTDNSRMTLVPPRQA